ncbi:MAG: hypothetical protein EZS28_010401 [Streblomastix strix]|uniref:Uncharacterized protein n=1 Tax=Streblomastix strix TaxID=222440 RepID=A0A5J4WGX1_9EUKA|nr:MAG: hypothetical protein EZS28_010401 [Streblomastix strix]
MMRLTNDHETRRKTGQIKSVPDISIQNPEARANSYTLNHSIPQLEQRKKTEDAPVSEVKSTKHSKGNKTSARSKKQKQGSNSEFWIEIKSESKTDQPEQLDLLMKKERRKEGRAEILRTAKQTRKIEKYQTGMEDRQQDF